MKYNKYKKITKAFKENNYIVILFSLIGSFSIGVSLIPRTYWILKFSYDPLMLGFGTILLFMAMYLHVANCHMLHLASWIKEVKKLEKEDQEKENSP